MELNFQYFVGQEHNLDMTGLNLPVVMQDPKDLIFIRHGESEANVMHAEHLKGRVSPEKWETFKHTPNNYLRLTDKGAEQARKLGEWWKDNVDIQIDRAITSYYVRAGETAGIFAKAAALEKHIWRKTSLVGERYWGKFEHQTTEEIANEYEVRKSNARLWTPPGGESLRSLESHGRALMGRMNRRYGMMGVIVVSHGEFITSMGSLIERYTDEQLNARIVSGIPNCGVVHYSRVNPNTNEIESHINWVRRISIFNPAYGKGEFKGEWDGTWKKIVRPEFTAEDLIAHARSYKKLL